MFCPIWSPVPNLELGNLTSWLLTQYCPEHHTAASFSLLTEMFNKLLLSSSTVQ